MAAELVDKLFRMQLADLAEVDTSAKHSCEVESTKVKLSVFFTFFMLASRVLRSAASATKMGNDKLRVVEGVFGTVGFYSLHPITDPLTKTTQPSTNRPP